MSAELEEMKEKSREVLGRILAEDGREYPISTIPKMLASGEVGVIKTLAWECSDEVVANADRCHKRYEEKKARGEESTPEEMEEYKYWFLQQFRNPVEA